MSDNSKVHNETYNVFKEYNAVQHIIKEVKAVNCLTQQSTQITPILLTGSLDGLRDQRYSVEDVLSKEERGIDRQDGR